MLEKWCEGKNRKKNVCSTKTKHVTNLSLPCFNLREQMEENNKVMNIMMIMTHTYEDKKTNVSTCMVIFEKIKRTNIASWKLLKTMTGFIMKNSSCVLHQIILYFLFLFP